MTSGISLKAMEAADEVLRKEKHMPNGLFSALAKAQTNMGKAAKDSTNPHFKSKYADLSSVMDACMPALNEAGIAVLQMPATEDGQMFVKTVLVHGETGEQSECRVPLIVGKNDMQGYGSAVTYARRYGLMSMAGIAPDDDDGNAAANAAPKLASSAHMRRRLDDLDKDLLDAGNEQQLTKLWQAWSKIMNEESWPVPHNPDDETAYRNVVKDRFRSRKEQFTETEVMEAAE